MLEYDHEKQRTHVWEYVSGRGHDRVVTEHKIPFNGKESNGRSIGVTVLLTTVIRKTGA